jgi:hypothetical protein
MTPLNIQIVRPAQAGRLEVLLDSGLKKEASYSETLIIFDNFDTMLRKKKKEKEKRNCTASRVNTN